MYRARILPGLLWNAAQSWGGEIAQLLLLLVLARLVRPDAFGAFALASACLAPVALLAGQGMGNAIVLMQEASEQHIATALWAVAISSLGLAAASVMAGPYLALLFHEPRLGILIFALAPGLVIFATGNIAATYERRNLHFKPVAIAYLAGRAVATIVAIAMALAGAGIWCLVARQLTEQTVTALLLWRPHWRAALHRPTLRHWRELSRAGNAVAAANLVPTIQIRGLELILGYGFGVQILGFFTIARRLVDAVAGLIPGLFSSVSWSLFPRLQDKPDELRATMFWAVGIIYMASSPILALLGGLAPLWVPLVLGTRWLPACPFVQALALGAVARILLGYNLIALVAAGGGFKRLMLELALTGALLLAVALALPLGIQGVTTAIALTPLLFAIPAFAILNNRAPVPILQQLRRCAVYLVAAIPMLAAMDAMTLLVHGLNSWGETALAGLVGMAVYAAVLELVAPRQLRRAIEETRIELGNFRRS